MAVNVTVHKYTQYGGRKFARILAELENPIPLLRNLGDEFRSIVVSEAPVGEIMGGTLRKGLEASHIYKKRSGGKEIVWAVGIGDPKILTDPRQKAPAGTIQAFVDWVRQQNRGVAQRKAVARAKRQAAIIRERAVRQAARVRARVAVVRQRVAVSRRGIQRAESLLRKFVVARRPSAYVRPLQRVFRKMTTPTGKRYRAEEFEFLAGKFYQKAGKRRIARATYASLLGRIIKRR